MKKTSPPANDNAKAKPAPACAVCGRPRAEKYDPFCSRRCADVDLYRWLNGKYAIPASEEREPGEGSGDEEE
jgi:endogenous inhibitor of DNA gyrase (YacG/DUF329 family)